MLYATKYTVMVDVYTESEEPEIAREMADGKINHLVCFGTHVPTRSISKTFADCNQR